MGEARRKAQEGLLSNTSKTKKKIRKNDSPRIIDWLPLTQKQRDNFFEISIKGGWIGIGGLVFIWLMVRIIGPAAGWWVPADLH